MASDLIDFEDGGRLGAIAALALWNSAISRPKFSTSAPDSTAGSDSRRSTSR
uniref:Unannotated protein n=1 Tax=freshwater metagenome TaxID=449393 RepID=A0A6J7P7A0_9ZZZZ